MSRRPSMARISRFPAAFALALLLIATVGPAPAARAASAASAVETDYPAVALHRVTSSAGFVHPGIGVSAEHLLTARRQVLAGSEPWASYYAAMIATKYSSTTFTSANAGSETDRPGTDAFGSSSVQSKFIDDAFRAYTQAILYVFTGNPAYRENGLRLLRIWGHMDPAKYKYYADAHIHTGVPLLRMLAAAELLRYSSVNAGPTGYDLTWQPTDTAGLTTNLIEPITATFLFSNTRFMNQHLYGLAGALAGAIFTDNLPRYRERVEWFSVNSTNPDTYANGALTSVVRRIDAKDPLNPYGHSFIQNQEMGRDQAHAWDDLAKLSEIGRLLTIQGTRLDPRTGTVSGRRDAVSPYRFAGDRLLAGADAFYAYMIGKTVPWIDTSDHGGVVSEAYRGRIFAPVDELYDVYRYDLGVDVARRAPHVALMARQSDGPVFYWGTAAYNFWNSNPDYNPDQWLSLPAPVAGQGRPAQADALVQVERRSVAMDGNSSVRREGDRAFVRLQGGRGGSTIAIRTLMYEDRKGYSPVGLLLRTNGEATLQIRKDQRLAPYRTLQLPDTGGQWRYVVYDMDLGLLPGTTAGENLAYFTVLAPARAGVDIDAVNLQAKTQLSPPTFAQGQQATLIAVAGEQLTRSLAAADSAGDPLHYAAAGLPAGATVDASTGTLAWSPTAGDVGSHRFVLTADDGTVDTVLDVGVKVAADRADAIAAASQGYRPGLAYVPATLESMTAARATAEQTAASGDGATFAASLVVLQESVSRLEPLNPQLPDRTLDFRRLASSPTLTGYAVANMADGDFNSTSGDLRAPFVLDFGADFRVRADAFGLQARWNFANRSEGANVYGSDDGVTWTLLSSRETTNTTESKFVMETIPVRDEVRGSSFRFLKVQVDHPGVPTDPAYPGISSFSELRIFGERSLRS
ncbi:putative Ig domain-containing protein [Actinoplanes sp. NPDC026619]|uniref:putative Ig domain-containing protein n=1 Tax=Actinoplanes sp. NPDC026619 TaxID=3155798 RepID=UPI0033C439D5